MYSQCVRPGKLPLLQHSRWWGQDGAERRWKQNLGYPVVLQTSPGTEPGRQSGTDLEFEDPQGPATGE